MLGKSLEHNYGALLSIRPNLRQNSRPQRCPIMINLCMVHMFPTVGRSNRSRSCVPALPSGLGDVCVQDLLPLPKAHLNNLEKANKRNHQNLFLFQNIAEVGVFPPSWHHHLQHHPRLYPHQISRAHKHYLTRRA